MTDMDPAAEDAIRDALGLKPSDPSTSSRCTWAGTWSLNWSTRRSAHAVAVTWQVRPTAA